MNFFNKMVCAITGHDFNRESRYSSTLACSSCPKTIVMTGEDSIKPVENDPSWLGYPGGYR